LNSSSSAIFASARDGDALRPGDSSICFFSSEELGQRRVEQPMFTGSPS
jgi:hypothetical protein